MAGIIAVAQTAEIALTAATTKTLLQVVAPTNQRLKVLEWGIFFDGVNAVAEPVQVELVKQTSAGTMSSLTPTKRGDPGSETLQATAQHTATVEPTTTDVYDPKEVHPQAGYEKAFPLSREIPVPGGGRIGVRATAPAGVNARAYIVYEE